MVAADRLRWHPSLERRTNVGPMRLVGKQRWCEVPCRTFSPGTFQFVTSTGMLIEAEAGDS